jgi:hypothetical protein
MARRFQHGPEHQVLILARQLDYALPMRPQAPFMPKMVFMLGFRITV